MNGLYRGARRYELTRDRVQNEEINIFVGKNFLQFCFIRYIVIPSDSIEVSKLRSTQSAPCDTKFEKFDKILIREASNAVFEVHDFFTDLSYCI